MLGIEAVGHHTAGLVAAGCRFADLGMLGSLVGRQLRRKVWRAGCRLLATPVAVEVARWSRYWSIL